MLLQYVDDSGDDGLVNSPTHFFVLTTLVLYEERWNDTFASIKEFRRNLRNVYGITLSDELKSNYLIRKQGFAYRLNLSEEQRIKIYQETIQFISELKNIQVFSICIRKDNLLKRDFGVYEFAWKLLFTRLHYACNRQNKTIGRTDKSVLISDETNEAVVRRLLRKLRVYNPINGKNFPLDTFIEDPFMRKSAHSHFIQLCDMIAFCVAGKNITSKLVNPFNFPEMYNKLEAVLDKTVCNTNKEAIVYFPK